VLGSCAGLFFGVLIAHSQLRSALQAASMVFIEHFFLIMYAMLLLVAANAYLFSVNEKILLLQQEDNLIPKILYWPVLMLLVLAVTMANFY